ncbi:hypothetical protein ACJMK2_008160 [Sinanodonta woodiana]|uniref:Uncharacterized protein n=1 Tax=Sinanodonta woodiana TaxID=1069815 RepID=A0ABD3VMB5_SINWO
MLKRKHSRNLSAEFPPLPQVMRRTEMEKKAQEKRGKNIPENKLELSETSDNDNDKSITPLNLDSPPPPKPIMNEISTINNATTSYIRNNSDILGRTDERSMPPNLSNQTMMI